MNNISDKQKKSTRELFFFRQRLKNKIFQSVLSYFNEIAENEGLTKKDIAKLLDKDPAQITRWFSGPKNWTLDTISDLLLAMGAEIKHEIVPLHTNKYQVTSMDSAEQAAYSLSLQDLLVKELTDIEDYKQPKATYLFMENILTEKTRYVELKGYTPRVGKDSALGAWIPLHSAKQSKDKSGNLDSLFKNAINSGIQQ